MVPSAMFCSVKGRPTGEHSLVRRGHDCGLKDGETKFSMTASQIVPVDFSVVSLGRAMRKRRLTVEIFRVWGELTEYNESLCT